MRWGIGAQLDLIAFPRQDHHLDQIPNGCARSIDCMDMGIETMFAQFKLRALTTRRMGDPRAAPYSHLQQKDKDVSPRNDNRFISSRKKSYKIWIYKEL